MNRERDFTRPPVFLPYINFQDWLERVAEWVATLKHAHDKGKNQDLATRFQLLGSIFFQGEIPSDRGSKIDDDIRKT